MTDDEVLTADDAAALRKGDRLVLVAMPADPDPIEPGEKCTVLFATPNLLGDCRTQIVVKWDNGRSLALVVPPDQVRLAGDIE